MGILGTVESAAEGAVVGGPVGAAAGAAKGFLQSLSLKQVFGFVAGIALLCLVGWAYRLNSVLHERDAQIEATAQAIQQAEGGKKPVARDLAAYVFRIAAERDAAKTADGLKKVALDNQSNTIAQLGQQSAAWATVSKQAVDMAKSSAASRDMWVKIAEGNAHRTTVLPDADELKQCKDAMDALYQNNF